MFHCHKCSIKCLNPIRPNYNNPTDREQEFLIDTIRCLNELFDDIGDEHGRQNFTNGNTARVSQKLIVVE